MRSDLRRTLATAVALSALILVACREEQPAGSATLERFAGVKKTAAQEAAGSAFCEKRYPATGDQARRYTPPPLRALPGAVPPPPARNQWTWLNLWATWCVPCVEEMELLSRWRDGFSGEGVPVSFELLSIDDESKEKELSAWRARKLPGAVRWLRSEADLPALLGSLGLKADAAIPIHALVDPSGFIRCVRVGAVHEQDYGAVKELLRR